MDAGAAVPVATDADVAAIYKREAPDNPGFVAGNVAAYHESASHAHWDPSLECFVTPESRERITEARRYLDMLDLAFRNGPGDVPTSYSEIDHVIRAGAARLPGKIDAAWLLKVKDQICPSYDADFHCFKSDFVILPFRPTATEPSGTR